MTAVSAILTVLYWSVAIWGLISRRPVLLYMFFASIPFGSFAVVPPGMTGGLTILPASTTALLLVMKTMADRTTALTALSSALDPRRLGVLTAFLAVAVVTTLFMPRLFAGEVLIIPMRGDLSNPAPLFPTRQNISQLAYLTLSVLLVFAFAQILKSGRLRQAALHGLVLGAALAIITGALDFAAQYLPLAPLLEPFRTATYTLHVDVELLGGKRVVGLMPEASSFGSLCVSMLGLLYFLRRGIRNERVRDLYAPVLILLLILFAWLSTSSATYLALALFFLVALVEWVVRLLERRYSPLRRRHLGTEFWGVVAALALVVIVALARPAVLEGVSEAVDRMVFQKAGSSSFTERNMWTAVSLNALVETYGLGVGIGGTRSSNRVVSMFSNAGVIGGLLYFAFFIQSLCRRAAPGDEEGRVLISAVRYSIVPSFLVGLLIGTSPDFGETGAFRFGLLAAIGLGGMYAYRAGRGGGAFQPMAGR